MGKLYHYSDVQMDVLRTLRKQGHTETPQYTGINSSRQKYYPGDYIDHISFFLEPIPLDTIAACFKHNHRFWISGKELFEHEVDIKHLKDFKYHLVESKLLTGLRDNVLDTSIIDNGSNFEQYLRLRNELQYVCGEIGDDNAALLEIQAASKGVTKECFEKIRMRADFDSIRDKYAATVPHLMVYPKTGLITVDAVRKVKIK